MIAADPQVARERVARLAAEATRLEIAGDAAAAVAVWDEHYWACNALRTPEDLLAEGLALIGTVQRFVDAAAAARPYGCP